MSIFFASFKHLKLPISIKVPVTIPWQLYPKFDFLNYIIAKLVVVLLYVFNYTKN